MAQEPGIRPTSKAALVASIGVTAAASLISLTSSMEGVRLTPYSDRLAGDLNTVCFGQTHVAMHPYTLPQCKDMLAGSLAGYAAGVRSATPDFDKLTDGQKVAAIDFAYNAGLHNWQISNIRRSYVAEAFPKACGQYLNWAYLSSPRGPLNCSIRSNNCYGIYNRRRAEEAACLGN